MEIILDINLKDLGLESCVSSHNFVALEKIVELSDL